MFVIYSLRVVINTISSTLTVTEDVDMRRIDVVMDGVAGLRRGCTKSSRKTHIVEKTSRATQKTFFHSYVEILHYFESFKRSTRESERV